MVNPPAVLLETDDLFDSLGGEVGVTVTVRTCPVTVSRDITGVGVHVELVEPGVVFKAATVVCVANVVVGVSEELVEVGFCLKSLAWELIKSCSRIRAFKILEIKEKLVR